MNADELRRLADEVEALTGPCRRMDQRVECALSGGDWRPYGRGKIRDVGMVAEMSGRKVAGAIKGAGYFTRSLDETVPYTCGLWTIVHEEPSFATARVLPGDGRGGFIGQYHHEVASGPHTPAVFCAAMLRARAAELEAEKAA